MVLYHLAQLMGNKTCPALPTGGSTTYISSLRPWAAKGSSRGERSWEGKKRKVLVSTERRGGVLRTGQDSYLIWGFQKSPAAAPTAWCGKELGSRSVATPAMLVTASALPFTNPRFVQAPTPPNTHTNEDTQMRETQSSSQHNT